LACAPPAHFKAGDDIGVVASLRAGTPNGNYAKDLISRKPTAIRGPRLMIWLETMLTAALVVAADQASKAFVLARWPLAGVATPRSFVSIRCMLNRQGTLAALAGVPALAALWAVMVVLAALTLHTGLLGHDALVPIGVGMALGGATGNVLDRLVRGAVVDFVAIGPWPVFNLADAALVAGTGSILLNALGGHA
jgi:signal peptidase II